MSSVTPSPTSDKLRVRVDLPDLTGDDRGLVDADLVDGSADTVHVRQLELIEVGEAKDAADTLHRQRQGDRAAGGQADDPDVEPGQPIRLVVRDLVAVAVEAKLTELGRRQEVDELARPRKVDPPAVLDRSGVPPSSASTGLVDVGRVSRRHAGREQCRQLSQLPADPVRLGPHPS